MKQIIRRSPTRETFVEPMLIILPYKGKVDSCLFKRHATIVYDRLGAVENNHFGSVTIMCDFPFGSPTDRTFERNPFSSLMVEGYFTIKNNIGIGNERGVE